MTTTRILVVANRTASTPMLLDEVTRRAKAGASFTLLVPPEKSSHAADDWSVEEGVDLLERASGESVANLDAGSDPFGTIHRAVDDGSVDEIILSTPREHLSHWIHHDLRHRLEHLGVPVRVIPPEPNAPPPDDLPQSWGYPPPTPGVAGTY